MSGRGKNYLQFAQYFEFWSIFWLGLPPGQLFLQHSPLIKFKFFSSATSILLLVRALKRSVGRSSHKQSGKVTQVEKFSSLFAFLAHWVSPALSPPSIYPVSHEPRTQAGGHQGSTWTHHSTLPANQRTVMLLSWPIWGLPWVFQTQSYFRNGK